MMDQANPARMRLERVTPALIVLLGGAQISTAPPAAAQPRTERVEHSVEIEPDTRVTIMNLTGHVEVHGTDPGEDRTLRVVGVKRLSTDLPPDEAERIFGRVNLNLQRRGRHIHIGPRRPRSEGDRRPSGPRGEDARERGETPITEIRPPRHIPPVSVDLELWLPEGASLEVRTLSAPITVSGVAAPEGTFLLRSISGALTVSGLEGRDLHAETISGDLRLADVASHRGSFKTLTAAITIAGQLHPEGWYDFQTHSGQVVLGLGSLPGFQLDARTFTGDIRNDLDIEAHAGPHSLEGRHGDGGPHITVNTFSGDIHLATLSERPSR